eukprot:700681-Amorphochlora_amoeboformis.AAC.1
MSCPRRWDADKLQGPEVGFRLNIVPYLFVDRGELRAVTEVLQVLEHPDAAQEGLVYHVVYHVILHTSGRHENFKGFGRSRAIYRSKRFDKDEIEWLAPLKFVKYFPCPLVS